MSTIIQPYNPWRETLAANILGPIIGGMIDNYRQKEQNRKINSAIAKSYADSNPAPVMTAPPQPISQPMSSNGWENAFRSAGSSLPQFDMNIANFMPPTAQAAAPVQPAAPVSEHDILSNLIANLGTERYSMINPEAVQKIIAPYLASTAQSRQEARQKQLGEALKNAKDTADRRNQAWGGYAQGILPIAGLQQAGHEYEYENPHRQPYAQNRGANTAYGSFNPFTGEYSQAGYYENTLTPQQAADNAYRDKAFNETVRANRANEDFRNRQLDSQNSQFNANLDYNRETRDIQREEANRPKYGAPFAVNGKLYQIDQNGDTRSFTIGGEHIDAPENFSAPQWGEADKSFIDNLNKQADDLVAKKQRILDNFPDKPEAKKEANRQLTEIDNQIKSIRDTVSAYILSKSTPRNNRSNTSSSGNLGSMMVGNANAGRITGRFGDKRAKGHVHKGLDIPAPEGELIRVMKEMGNNLKVIAVDTNPNNSTNYGNYVVLEGKRGGKTVRYTIAHMKTGSVKVKTGDILKAGDIIGGVGSTGRSTGNHLHLEVMVDGQRVDPETFLEKYPLETPQYLPPSNNNPQPQAPQAANPSNSQQKNSQPQTEKGSAIWVSKNGTHGITQQEYDNILQEIKTNGKIKDERTGASVSSQRELDEWLMKEGWSRPGSSTTPAQTTAKSVDPSLDWRPSYQKVNMSQALTRPAEIVNHATKADVQNEVNKLNGEQPQEYFNRWNIFPAGFLGIR